MVEALAFCNSIESKLFEPKDLPSNDFVTTEAKARGVSQFWIGIHDIQTEGTFRYDSNDDQITCGVIESGLSLIIMLVENIVQQLV